MNDVCFPKRPDSGFRRNDVKCQQNLAVIAHLGIQDDPDCYKEIAIGKARYKRYSQKVIPIVSQCLETEDLALIWKNRPKSMRKSKS